VEATEIKLCKVCREPIPFEAKKCIKCQSWQSYRDYYRNNPQLWYSILFLLITIPLMLLPFYFLRMDHGAAFTKYRDQIELISSDMRFDVDRDGRFQKVITIGKLKNNSPYSWKDIHFEVQYFDQNDKLIATTSEKIHDLVLLPGTEHAFQIVSQAEGPEMLYSSQKVYIREATESGKY
jgi:predicted nucleic acid-binding Zn ribbon protein